jgi:hypothetical protein
LARKWAKSQTPAATTIKARTNGSGRCGLNNFIFCAGINQAALILVEDNTQVIRGSKPLKKTLKKVKKKLARPWHLPLNGDLTRQIGPKAVQKNLKKVKKKLVSDTEI